MEDQNNFPDSSQGQNPNQNPNQNQNQNPYGPHQNPNSYGQNQNPNPYGQNQYNQNQGGGNPYQQNPYQQQPGYGQDLFGQNVRITLPNATAVLVMGILSLVFIFCYGLGLVFGIIGLALSSKGRALYKSNPGFYDGYGQLNAGWVMSIIGVSISALFWLFVAIVGTAALSSSWYR